MEKFSFAALGTQWNIVVDGQMVQQKDMDAMLEQIAVFERRFSRFIATSEVNRFRSMPAGLYELSETLTALFVQAEVLRSLTDGRYDPAVGQLLEHAGYDATYGLQSDTKQVDAYLVPTWSLQEKSLLLGGSAVFDFGGIGKGYCIDLMAHFLQQAGYDFFLIEGGGDMYGTTKANGDGFRVALEWPGTQDMAFGVVQLKHQGIAVSDSFKRRWKEWHHILDPHTKKPVQTVIGCAALATSAFFADCMTSGLFLAVPTKYTDLQQSFGAEYVVFRNDDSVVVSKDWPGELFS